MVFRLLFLKDLQLLLRSKHALMSTFGFALLLVVVASFAFRQVGLTAEQLLSMTPGILLTIYLFAVVVALRVSFLPEYQNGAIVGVSLSGVDPWAIVGSKIASNTTFIFVLFVFVSFLHQAFFGVDLSEFGGELATLLFLFALGVASLGTLLSALALVTSIGEILLPLVLFPLLIPLVIGVLELMRTLFDQGSFPLTGYWFTFVGVFDLISLILSLVLFEHVVKE